MSPAVHGALVFADLAGFTAFTAERGDVAAVELVDLFEAEVGAVLPPSSRVVKNLGDGLFLWFPEVVSAVDAMTELVVRCRLQVANGLPMWVRVGVHVGSALKRGRRPPRPRRQHRVTCHRPRRRQRGAPHRGRA